MYPEARSLEELVRILQRERTLPLGWDPGGAIADFRATETGFRIAVVVAGVEVAIEPPLRDNPYAMFWLPPHRP